MSASLTNLLILQSTAYTMSGSAPAVNVPLAVSTLAVDVNVTAVGGTSPTLALFLERQGADGIWYSIWAPAAVTAAGAVSTSVGPGCATPASLTGMLRLRWQLGGTTPSFTFSASVVARAMG